MAVSEVVINNKLKKALSRIWRLPGTERGRPRLL